MGPGERVEPPVMVRIGTYNILNTKDRYLEREHLLKQNLYEMNADIIGLQEVVYGSE
jgi:mRNA deadenylase 3'-5' endonuclease subunit Ccr4